MDAKITKVRLNRMLSYDWIKIIAVAVATIIVWTLIFTMTSTRITPAQQFTVMNYLGNDVFDDSFNNHLRKTYSSKVFSFEILEEPGKVDLAGNKDMASELLSTRTATEEGDVIFVADADDLGSKKTDKETGEITYQNTYLEEFARGYSSILYEVDDFVQSMQMYLEGYYENGAWEDESKLKEDLVKADFRARIKNKKYNGNRFKTKKQIAQGEKLEVARIKKYATALKKFQGWYNAGLVSYTEVVIQEANAEKNQAEIKGTYAINLCPTGVWGDEQEKKLSELVSYKGMKEVAGTDKDGNPTTTLKETSGLVEDMSVCLFKFRGVTPSFQYESMLYIVSVLEYALG